ncbi:MAG: hypothetical protein KatS3mg110_0347 [Pirellulaceae bacterium]|nr:MAG: hypothetical protein KatS3mg110_0347 [Pirellulaceae bacterium]
MASRSRSLCGHRFRTGSWAGGAGARRGRPHRAGLSLLELILALGLSALVLYAISMAVDLHLRVLDVRRTQVEEAQIARAVLQSIANDLRGIVPHYRVDLSAVEQMMVQAMASAAEQLAAGGSAAAGGGTSGSGSSGGSGGASTSGSGGAASGGSAGAGAGSGSSGAPPGGAAGLPSSGSSAGRGQPGTGTGTTGSPSGSTGSASGGVTPASGSGSTASGGNSSTGGGTTTGSSVTGEEMDLSNTTNLASGTVSPPTVGLYGNQYELQIDVSRLPRPDQYYSSVLSDPTSLPAIPSDIKSVTYYVQTPELGVGQVRDPLAGAQASQQPATGLVRREVDRAVLQYAVSYGTTDSLARTGDLLAPEVVGIEFQYFDGSAWLTYWDSDQMGGLPLAVEVVLMIQPKTQTSSSWSLFGLFGVEQPVPEPVIYRLMVYLPMSQIGSTSSTQSLDSGLENLGL